MPSTSENEIMYLLLTTWYSSCLSCFKAQFIGGYNYCNTAIKKALNNYDYTVHFIHNILRITRKNHFQQNCALTLHKEE